MKRKVFLSISVMILIALFANTTPNVYGFAPPRSYFQIKIYQLKDKDQEERVDKFLQQAYLPALHRAGIGKVGVFKQIGNDTAAIRRVYVLIPFKSMDQFTKLPEILAKDNQYLTDGKNYIDAVYDDPPYQRIESILLQAFTGMPGVDIPQLKGPKSEQIYELRSYEGASEKIYDNKVKMFNDGDEIGLFKRLGFNAVFYAEVVSGSHMPNLMYMTSFENMASHDAHWKSFGDDPVWKKLVAMPEYQHNVSHADIMLLHPAEYSDL
ncbi:MAG: NIPSNAP family protein [Bacteroidetes bacterium]|nr:NIPSNAP family protein [Bacteroidota bacterium]